MSEIPNEPASVSPATDSINDADNTDDIKTIEDFLRAHGAEDMPHPGGTLLAHLIRVSDLLAEWGAPPEVRIAGLCHATYGTDGFAPSLLRLADRAVLVGVIGERAEALVYLYASCDRAATYPRLRADEGNGENADERADDRPVFRDRFTAADFDPSPEALRAFLEITAANELDVFAHNEDLATRYGPGLYRLLTPVREHLSAPAWEAVRSSLASR